MKLFRKLLTPSLSMGNINNRIAPYVLIALKGLPIKKLDLSGNKFEDKAIASLAEATMPKLEELDLSHNLLQYNSFSILGKFLLNHPNLKKLSLKNAGVLISGNLAIMDLAPYLKESNLVDFDFRGNNINEDGLCTLADNTPKTLKSLSLSLSAIHTKKALNTY